MDDKGIHILSAKLDTIIKLMVFSMTHGKNQTEQIMLFSKAGFQPKEIAEILDTTANSVRVALSNLRKKQKKRN